MKSLPAVLMVGPLPPPSGGMANQTRQLVRLLEQEGLPVKLVQTNAPYSAAWIAKLRGVRAAFRMVPYVLRLNREIRHADVVHVMANSGLAWFLCAAPAIHLAALHGIPVVVNYRGGLAEEFLARSARWVIPTLRKANRVVVPSGFLRAVFGRHQVVSEVIPNIVDTGIFHPAAQDLAVPAAPHIVIARNLERIYGIDTAIRALSVVRGQFPSLKASIAGSGPERASLEQLVASLGLADSVRFTGRLEVEEMASLYRQANLVLNPTRADNMPNSVLEALASGVPVVSTDVGGIPYLVEHGRTAWLVPPDEPQRMAEAVVQVLNDRLLYSRMRAAGLRLAATFGWPEVRRRWMDTYQGLAA